MRLKGRISIITGASRGLGLAVAKLFYKEGAVVIGADIVNPDKDGFVEAYSDEEKVIYKKVDITKPEQVKKFASEVSEKFGKVDVLVNNAAINSIGNIEESTEEDFRQTININVFGTFLMTKYIIPLIKKTGRGGSIINVASNIGLMGMAGRIAYTTSKGAIINFSRSMALDYAADNIRVNSIAPGAMNTEMVIDFFKKKNDPELERQINAMHALNRFAEPDEIARAILFLAGDESSYATGSVLVIDGGYTCGK